MCRHPSGTPTCSWRARHSRRWSGRALVEVQADVVDLLLAVLELDIERVGLVLRALGTPERFHHGLAVHRVLGRVVGVLLGVGGTGHVRVLGHVRGGLGGGVDVGAGLGEQVGHALIGIEGNLIGGLHVLDGFGADGNLGTGIVLDLDRSRSRVIDEVRQLVGGEGELAAHVQAVASRTTVVAAVLVPYDGDILIVVAQVVYREVVPTGDFDRV